jgi:hypothetical protein
LSSSCCSVRSPGPPLKIGLKHSISALRQIDFAGLGEADDSGGYCGLVKRTVDRLFGAADQLIGVHHGATVADLWPRGYARRTRLWTNWKSIAAPWA